MWPWEHLAIGYLGYVIYYRLNAVVPPHRPIPLLALVFGTQFPDLVDKPLAWAFGVLPGGTSLAHSILIAPLLIVAVWIIAAEREVPAVGAAFGIGYLLHLPADFLFPLVYGDAPDPGGFLWPLVITGAPERPGFLGNVLYYVEKFRTFLGTPRGLAYLVFEGLLILGALVVFHRMTTRPVE